MFLLSFFTIITVTVVIIVTIAVVVFAVAGVVIANSDVAFALILVVDSVIAGVLVYFLLLFPLLLRSSWLIFFCKRNSFLIL